MDKEFFRYQESIERQMHQIWAPHEGQYDIVKAFLIDWAEGVFLQCGRKFGKALALDTPILTPSGFKPIGEIKDGDIVFDERGDECTVTHAHDVIKNAESYRVHFCNGTYIDACKDHQWLTWTKRDRKNHKRDLSYNPSVKSTLEIFNSQKDGKEYNHSIPYADIVDMKNADVFGVDPYILGAWLGDGNTADARFSSIDKEILDEIREEYEVTKLSGENCDYYIRGLQSELRKLNVLGNKHIPEDYLYSTYERRLALLQGLMDTDGTINKSGNCCEFYSTLECLADGVEFLVSSLGMKPIRKIKKTTHKDCHIVRFRPLRNVFRLPRKLERVTVSKKLNHHTIVKVEKIANVDMRCLTVDSPSRLFLAGKNLIPTHNTELAVYMLYMFALLFENAECYFIADEKDHARKILWNNGRLPRFFTSFRQQKGESYEDFNHRRQVGEMLQNKWVKSVNNVEMAVTLHNNSMIMVEGAKNFSKADGLSPAFAVYDEFKHHDERFDIAMRPNLRTFNGRILIMGTPPDNEENYYCKIADEFRHKKNHIWVQKPSYCNPHVYDGPEDDGLAEEEKEYRRREEWHIFAREYLAQIVPDQNAMIFPMLDKKKHVGKYEEMVEEIRRRNKDWDLYVSFDPASSSVFGVLLVAIHKHDKRVWLLDEIYETSTMNTRAKHIFERAREKWRAINPYDGDWHKIYDHAEKWFQVEIAGEFDEAIFPCEKDLKNKEAKLSVIKDTMIYDRFLVSDKCPKTLWELQLYKKDEKGMIPKENDHNIDNLRYILNANYYVSVPHEPLVIKDDRRGFKMEEELSDSMEAERLMGGLWDDDYNY